MGGGEASRNRKLAGRSGGRKRAALRERGIAVRPALPRLPELHAGCPAPPNNCLVSAKCYIKRHHVTPPPRCSLAGSGEIVTKPDSFVTALCLLLLASCFLASFLRLFVFTLYFPLATWIFSGPGRRMQPLLSRFSISKLYPISPPK